MLRTISLEKPPSLLDTGNGLSSRIAEADAKVQYVSPDALDLSSLVSPGDTVTWGQACGEPLTLTEALVNQRASIGRTKCFLGASFSATLRAEHSDWMEFLALGAVGSMRKLSGALDIFPAHMTALDRWIRDGSIRIDVAFVQVAPPNAKGQYSLGVSSDYIRSAVDAAQVVIAEVNDRVPATFCAAPLTADDIDVVVETSRDVVELPPATFGEIETRIARNALDYIPDGAVLQIGIGGLPDAICASLHGHRDLGVHSGMIGDAIADLVRAGVVTNARKEVDPGVSIACSVIGTRRLFDLVNENESLRMESIPYTHGSVASPRLRNFIAINGAIEVDLTGQVNSEAIDGRYVGAVGGQVDFVRAANLSTGGCAILALPSVTKDGRSRIVAQLSGPVTTARSDAAVIITEHGSADLRGASLKRRVGALTAIAAPEHRAALERAAFEILRTR